MISARRRLLCVDDGYYRYCEHRRQDDHHHRNFTYCYCYYHYLYYRVSY